MPGSAIRRSSVPGPSGKRCHLTTEFADLRKHLFTDEGKLRSFVNVYVNDEDIRYLAKENTPTKDGDTISIIPSIAGGIEGYNRHCAQGKGPPFSFLDATAS